jgi:hypothetical protein
MNYFIMNRMWMCSSVECDTLVYVIYLPNKCSFSENDTSFDYLFLKYS